MGLRTITVSFLLFTLLSCGGKTLTDGQKADVSKALGGVFNSSGSSLQMRSAIDEVRHSRVSLGILCTATSSSGCTFSCNSDKSVLTITCSNLPKQTETCGSTTYTLTNETAKVILDASQVSGTTGSYTGSYTFTANVSASITGGTLSGGTLACNLSVTEDASSTSTKVFTPTCGTDYTCTYDGGALSCSDLKTLMQNNKCS